MTKIERNVQSQPKMGRGYLVAEIRIRKLFGRYTYRISPLTTELAKRGGPPLMLLYGDNGSGKTTIMQLLWDMFSPSQQRGHRSRIAHTPFLAMTVLLGNGDLINVQKGEDLVGGYTITVSDSKGKLLIRQPYVYDDVRGNVQSVKGGDPEPRKTQSPLAHFGVEVAGEELEIFERYGEVSGLPFEDQTDYFVEYLGRIGTTPYLLADDRQMYSDDKEVFERTPRRVREEAQASSKVALELRGAIRRTNDWLRQQLFSGSQAGSQNAEQIYREVLTHLASAGSAGSSNHSFEEVRTSIIGLEERTKRFSEFGLVPPISARRFLDLMDEVPKTRRDLVANVLSPYIEGQNARLDSLQNTERLVRVFTDSINSFLSDKEVRFSPSHGLRIWTLEKKPVNLEPVQLSSGERQLLLLFCNALLARETTGLFLIDEPELSLNVKWQRQLVDALLNIVQEANVQFILATHSIEIVARHRPYLAMVREEQE